MKNMKIVGIFTQCLIFGSLSCPRVTM